MIGAVAAAGVLLVGGGVAVWVVTSRGGGGDAESTTYTTFVALDGARALQVTQGNESLTVEGVRRAGASLATTWRWSPGADQGVHPWMWERRGDLVLGEFHPARGEGPRRAVLFDARTGFVGAVTGLRSGSFGFADDHTAVAATATHMMLIDATRPTAAWQAPVPAGRFVPFVGGSATRVVVWNGALHSIARSDPTQARTLASVDDIVGLAATRDEALVVRQGRVDVVNLATGEDRVSLDLGAGSPVAEGIDTPCLLGRHGGLWLVVYATARDQIFTHNNRSWSIPARKTVAAVDAATGEVRWRVPLGSWEMRCTEQLFQHTLPSDRELPQALVFHGTASVRGGGGERGILGLLDLGAGVVRWQTTYEHAGLGGNFFVYRGPAVYARLGVYQNDALIRFEQGRLTGAVRLGGTSDRLHGPGTALEGAWVGGAGWSFLAAPGLGVAATSPEATPTEAARDWAILRFALPPAAR